MMCRPAILTKDLFHLLLSAGYEQCLHFRKRFQRWFLAGGAFGEDGDGTRVHMRREHFVNVGRLLDNARKHRGTTPSRRGVDYFLRVGNILSRVMRRLIGRVMRCGGGERTKSGPGA
uniref:Uncharacterized protein n=1 Tax=Cacopsylla melanoneura TaxID=428564 RepID=A0A8D9EWR8_9HEMI